MCEKGSSPTHWIRLSRPASCAQLDLFSLSGASQCFILEPLPQSLCSKWLNISCHKFNQLTTKRHKDVQNDPCMSVHRAFMDMSVSRGPSPHDPPMFHVCSKLSPPHSLFSVSLLSDSRRTKCCDQHYGNTLFPRLNKLVAFYWAARHSEDSVSALLLYWHLKKINCAQGGFQLVNSYYNSASFMYN